MGIRGRHHRDVRVWLGDAFALASEPRQTKVQQMAAVAVAVAVAVAGVVETTVAVPLPVLRCVDLKLCEVARLRRDLFAVLHGVPPELGRRWFNAAGELEHLELVYKPVE